MPIIKRDNTSSGDDDIDRAQTADGREQTGAEKAASLARHWRRETGAKTPKEPQ